MMASTARMQDDGPQCHSEVIAQAYLIACDGDPHHALVRAIADALSDLCEAERRTRRQDRLISHGYVRGDLGLEGRS